MGQCGVDVVLSPAGRRVFDLCIEAKNVEKLVVPTVFFKHYAKYITDRSLKLLIHAKNRTEPLVTLRFKDFLVLLDAVVVSRLGPGKNVGKSGADAT